MKQSNYKKNGVDGKRKSPQPRLWGMKYTYFSAVIEMYSYAVMKKIGVIHIPYRCYANGIPCLYTHV